MRPGFIWLAGIRDLDWRRRRFVIAVFGTALVMAITLLLTGFLALFDVEVHHATHVIAADGFIVQAGRAGPFLGGSPIPVNVAQQARSLPGVTAASPMIMTPQVTNQRDHKDVYLVGAQPGMMGAPTPRRGAPPMHPGEAVIDTRSGLKIGDTFEVSGHQLNVVGLVTGQTVLRGNPTVYVTLGDAQQIMFGGQPYVTTVAVKGTPTSVPAGSVYVTRDAAGHDLKRPLEETIKSIQLFRTLLWVVSVAVVGSVVYLSALERVSDFAVFKATGTATIDLMGALVVQAVALAFTASVASIGLAFVLRPAFPVPPLLPIRLQLTMPALAIVIGIVSSGAALRRAVTVDPALAFGGH